MPVYLLIGRTASDPVFFDTVNAADPQTAETLLLQRLSSGLSVDKTGARNAIQYGLLEFVTQGTVTPNADPSQATLTSTGNTATQATLLQQAATALANNQTYLGIGSPTTAQAVSQVAALTRQVDVLIRFAIQNFSGIS